MKRPPARSRDPLSDLDRLQAAAAKLSRLEREVLILSAAGGLRNREIAARLGIGERDAERLFAEALRKLDRELGRSNRRWWRFW